MQNTGLHPSDYYIDPETGYIVFTASYHVKRGFCCGSGCRHCPFQPKNVKNSVLLRNVVMNDEKIKQHLKEAKNIAVIGFSKDPAKTAYKIPMYLTKHYKVFPINPSTDTIEGLTCYKSITEIQDPIDIVDVFRPGPQCSEIMKEIIQIIPKPKLVWLQLHITNEEAKKLAVENNIDFIEDKCIYVERERLL